MVKTILDKLIRRVNWFSTRPPFFYALMYFGLVFAFTIIYLFVPNLLGTIEVNGKLKALGPWETLSQSFYFSVITITTLGYGDISPTTVDGQLWTAIEAISGIIMIGLFLNALSFQHSEHIKSKEEKKQIKELKLQKLNHLKTLNSLIKLELDNVIYQIADMLPDLDLPTEFYESSNTIQYREEFKKLSGLTTEENGEILPILLINNTRKLSKLFKQVIASGQTADWQQLERAMKNLIYYENYLKSALYADEISDLYQQHLNNTLPENDLKRLNQFAEDTARILHCIRKFEAEMRAIIG